LPKLSRRVFYRNFMHHHEVIIIGAGAAGLMCAIEAGKRGRKVLVLDHARKPAEKIRISGGGRCNFTNIHTNPRNFISQNPQFCVSALTRYTPHDFIALVKKHNIAFHEKTLGQLFCDGSAQQIISMLLQECELAGVQIQLETTIEKISKDAEEFHILTSSGHLRCGSLVIACGGLSIPKIGATGLGYDIAKHFGIGIVPTSPALVPFTLTENQMHSLQGLSGIAVDATVKLGKQQFREGLLFTHRGLSGPAILQISSYWKQGQGISINLLPEYDAETLLLKAKAAHPKQEPATALAQWLPKRLAQILAGTHEQNRLADIPDKKLQNLATHINAWSITPSGTEGYRTAEVTLGGIDTNELSSKTMECKKLSGLFCIGEVVDVTGHLGGFNFQWAWSSGFAAGQYC